MYWEINEIEWKKWEFRMWNAEKKIKNENEIEYKTNAYYRYLFEWKLKKKFKNVIKLDEKRLLCMFKIRRVLKLRVAISFFTFDYVNLLMKIHFVLIGTFLLLKIRRKKSLTQNFDQNSIKKI